MNTSIIDYTIVCGDEDECFLVKVDRHLKEGYELIGGAFVFDDFFAQTMVLYEQDPNVGLIKITPFKNNDEIYGDEK